MDTRHGEKKEDLKKGGDEKKKSSLLSSISWRGRENKAPHRRRVVRSGAKFHFALHRLTSAQSRLGQFLYFAPTPLMFTRVDNNRGDPVLFKKNKIKTSEQSQSFVRMKGVCASAPPGGCFIYPLCLIRWIVSSFISFFFMEMPINESFFFST